MPSAPNPCNQCRFAIYNFGHECDHTDTAIPHVVYGSVRPSCYDEREPHRICGRDGLLFEPLPPKHSLIQRLKQIFKDACASDGF